MKLEKLKLYMQSLKEDKNESAFTLIELIVVMAILAILVLLAAPQFLGYTEKAKVANIQNDTAVVEGVINEGLVLDTEEIEEFLGEGAVSNEILTKAYNDGKLYGKGGRLNEVEGFNITDISGKKFIAVTPDLLDKTNSQLDGVFYADEDGNVLYLDDERAVAEEESRDYGGYDTPEERAWVDNLIDNEGYTMGTYSDDNDSTDFRWSSNGYAEYWGYNGSDIDKVIIPKVIDGQLVSSHNYMFAGRDDVLAVASMNPNVVSTDGMFEAYRGPTLDLSEYSLENITSTNRMFYWTDIGTITVSSEQDEDFIKSIDDTGSIIINVK